MSDEMITHFGVQYPMDAETSAKCLLERSKDKTKIIETLMSRICFGDLTEEEDKILSDFFWSLRLNLH